MINAFSPDQLPVSSQYVEQPLSDTQVIQKEATTVGDETLEDKTSSQTRLLQILRQWWLLIVGVCVLLGVIGFGLWLRLRPTSVSVSIDTTVVPPINSTPSQLESAQGGLSDLLASNEDMITYSNSECSYTFKHPGTWLRLNETTENEVNTVLIASENITQENQNNVFRIQVACTQIEQIESPPAVIDALLVRYQNQNAQISARLTTPIGNGTAFYHMITLPSGEAIQEYYIFRKPGQVIVMAFQPYATEHEELIKKIVSSSVVSE
jgi:hypothetical protein